MSSTDIERLLVAIQDLSHARSLDAVVEIVRTAARQLTGADGATFILRDGSDCFYVDEDAIEPLWKGRRFPMAACVSGWAMLHRASAVIEDIYADARVPVDAYRPTFVRSMVMVPIRTTAPLGAIGNYWAQPHQPSEHEVQLLQALADSTSIALEHVDLHRGLESRVAERTSELEALNADLARRNAELHELQRQTRELSALIAHDINSPATAMRLRALHCLEQGGAPSDLQHWRSVLNAADRISRMALDLVDTSRSESGAISPRCQPVRLAELLTELGAAFTSEANNRRQGLALIPLPVELELQADPELLRRVLYNLVDNSLRYSGPGSEVRVEVCAAERDHVEIKVSDTGPGIPADMRERVFDKYVRLAPDVSVGRGLGLSFCRLAVEAHGGRVWVDGNEPRGCRFHVLLPMRPGAP